jgi:REP element-mobilizing transposase RayT
MVYAYHVIIPMYGFWLPNDPRGSWSDYIRKWELLKFGGPSRTLQRRTLDQLSPKELRLREAARAALDYPPVSLEWSQIEAVARGFAEQVEKSGYVIWACSILPEHTHMVIARHSYKIEQVVNLLKGAATTRLIEEGCHPLIEYAKPGERPPRMWAAREWDRYLDNEEAIERAIRYVEENPIREGWPRQSWPFVTPFLGLGCTGGWITHHDRY